MPTHRSKKTKTNEGSPGQIMASSSDVEQEQQPSTTTEAEAALRQREIWVFGREKRVQRRERALAELETTRAAAAAETDTLPLQSTQPAWSSRSTFRARLHDGRVKYSFTRDAATQTEPSSGSMKKRKRTESTQSLDAGGSDRSGVDVVVAAANPALSQEQGARDAVRANLAATINNYGFVTKEELGKIVQQVLSEAFTGDDPESTVNEPEDAGRRAIRRRTPEERAQWLLNSPCYMDPFLPKRHPE